ncbi:histone family protein nucleoid-structuring protein H-NS [Caballeronia concitans]|uniref:Histone family protein nucleoid-structuring protein H-NS n=2 Tax=Caballeronia concitans TaxID=1777133 RepID=A0A658R2X6_9BURK|nr:histone family protein nucleoid-structuring protein H-NS [Burkholderia sp. MR1]SAL43966.1 histone family protein nucleoid-structuring protein H-NS [Caballeronia concitans]
MPPPTSEPARRDAPSQFMLASRFRADGNAAADGATPAPPASTFLAPPDAGADIEHPTHITNMTYRSPQVAELMAQRESLEKELAEARRKEERLALIEIVQKMREYGITLNELLGRKPEAPHAAPDVAIKYRDPASGATWSGRGRAPHWIAGKDRDAFLASRPAAGSSRWAAQASLFADEE